MGYRRTLTVFLGSPGDLAAERDAVQATVEEMNRILANGRGFQLELIRWEDSAPGFGNPQERLNRDLDRADLFIGLLNRKWGSPPASKGPYTSGFEEEYRRSLERRSQSGAPEMMVLFKTVPEEFLQDIGPDLRRVLNFREELNESKAVFYKTFDDVPNLQYRLRAALASWISGLSDADEGEAEETASEPRVDAASTSTVKDHQPAFSVAASQFLTDLAVARRPDGVATPAEVARLRLLATRSVSPQNDALALGPHDANLLYAEYPHDALGADDIEGLKAAGYDHFKAKNVPLWTWVRREGRDVGETLSLDTLIQAPGRPRAGAVRALHLLGLNAQTGDFDRSLLAGAWLDGSQDAEVRLAALTYLRELGDETDLDTLWKAYANKAAGQLDEVALAIVSIFSRIDEVEALRQLLLLAPPAVPRTLVEKIFSAAKTAPLELLTAALTHRSGEVRKAAVTALAHRGDTVEQVRAMAADEDADVRDTVLASLLRLGETPTPDAARQILVRSNRNALWSFRRPTILTGLSQWEAYRDRRIGRWSPSELAPVLRRSLEPHLVLAYIGVLNDPTFLRDVVDAEGRIDLQSRWPATEGGPNPPKVEPPLSDGLVEAAIHRLAELDDPSDLARVRAAFEETSIELREPTFRYLGRRGDRSDVDRIVAAVTERRGRFHLNLLSLQDRTAEIEWAADAVIALLRNDWAALLQIRDAPNLLSHFIQRAPIRAWANLTDRMLLDLLSEADDRVREIAVLRSLRDLPARRIRALLDAYLALTTRYYSVIHWLDLGVALPRDIVVSAARRQLGS